MRLSCNGKIIQNATWYDVETALNELKDEAFFRVSIWPWPTSGPISLEVQSEDGNYRPVMSVNEKPPLRVFVNPEGREKEDVSIGGYDYDAMSVTQDFALITRMVKEFFETGNVSPDLLK